MHAGCITSNLYLDSRRKPAFVTPWALHVSIVSSQPKSVVFQPSNCNLGGASFLFDPLHHDLSHAFPACPGIQNALLLLL